MEHEKGIVTPYLLSYNVRLNPQLVVKGCLTWTMESAHPQSPVPRDLYPPYLLSSDLRLNPSMLALAASHGAWNLLTLNHLSKGTCILPTY